MKKYVLYIGLLMLFVACKKAEMQEYVAGPGAYFNDIMGDSTNYSFANQIELKDKDTLFLKMRIMGDLANYDREIQLVPDEGTTATEGIHFVLPKVIIPANVYTFTYPVVLLKTADMSSKLYRLVVKIGQNKDFVNGSGMITNSRLYNKYKINFNNALIKPDYWLYIQNYFGEYSNVKYRFMIDVLGLSDFRPDQIGGVITYSQFINYSGQLSGALEEYVKLNGPLLDETNKEIYFPL